MIFPPGLARLRTNPAATGSVPALAITMGIVDAASLAAAFIRLPLATIPSALRRTRSARSSRALLGLSQSSGVRARRPATPTSSIREALVEMPRTRPSGAGRQTDPNSTLLRPECAAGGRRLDREQNQEGEQKPLSKAGFFHGSLRFLEQRICHKGKPIKISFFRVRTESVWQLDYTGVANLIRRKAIGHGSRGSLTQWFLEYCLVFPQFLAVHLVTFGSGDILKPC